MYLRTGCFCFSVPFILVLSRVVFGGGHFALLTTGQWRTYNWFHMPICGQYKLPLLVRPQ